jgi:hypothetical protein
MTNRERGEGRGGGTLPLAAVLKRVPPLIPKRLFFLLGPTGRERGTRERPPTGPPEVSLGLKT